MMKECKYCGTQRNDDEQYCPNCGASAVITDEERAYATAEEQEEQRRIAAEKSRMSPRAKLVLILSVIVVVIIITIVIIVSAISANNNKVVADGKTNNEITSEYDNIKSLYSQGKYEEALEAIDEIPEEYQYYSDVQATKDKIIDDYASSIISNVDDYISSGDYSDALALLTKGLETTGDNDTLSQKYSSVLSDCKSSYMSKAKEYADAGNYTEAISTLETISSVIESDADIDAKILEYKKAIITKKLSEYEKNEDYASAISYLEKELSDVGNDVDLTAKLNSYKTTYRENVIADAEAAYNSSGYEEAVSVLSDALKIMPDDSTLLEKKESYQQLAPDLLKNMNTIGGGLEVEDEICSDVFGNEYPPDNLCSIYHNSLSGDDGFTLYINNKYTTLTGQIVKRYTSSYAEEIYIYGTNEETLEEKTLLYSKKFYDTTEPDTINIKISGYKYLCFESDASFYLNNFEFYK